MPVLSIDNIRGRERELRRAHFVLTSLVQFYAHTVPPSESITIPRSLTVPLLCISKDLRHAPFITYFDHALHNWSHKGPCNEDALPTGDNIRAQITFTGTLDENELYRTDICLELKGAEAVELLRLATEEVKSSHGIKVEHVAEYLRQTAGVIEEMKDILMSTKKLVRPEIFFHDIRPWLVGADSDAWGRKWVWEDCDKVEGSEEMLTKISGPTAGQSPLVPTLDAYLGIEEDDSKRSFLDRVQVYMAHEHEVFLQGLRSKSPPIRSFVQRIAKEQGKDSPILIAYNAAIKAMKSFRDAHLVIVALYAIIPSKMKTKNHSADKQSPNQEDGLVDIEMKDGSSKDDQGAQLMKFLKGFRDKTDQAHLK